MKAWYQSKTIWVNVITGALAVAAQLSNTFPITQYPLFWSSTITVLNVFLRLITGQPIGTTIKS